jgi:hypothetical protein
MLLQCFRNFGMEIIGLKVYSEPKDFEGEMELKK